MGHSHHHSHQRASGKGLLISILLNLLITISQVIGGFISGSLSLLSDALHNFSDVLSLVISYIATILSRKEASTHKTFGYKRAEIMAAFVNAATLIVVAVILIVEAVERFLQPREVESSLVIWLSLLGILVNGFSVVLIKKESGNNMNMKSAYYHLLTDMMASVAVLLGGILMMFFKIYWIDRLLTLAIALYLIYVGYDLIKAAAQVLMLFTPETIEVKNIVSSLCKLESVKNVHHLHVWQLNEDEVHLEAHITFEENIRLSEFDRLLTQIEEILFHEYDINHVNIQPEYGKCDTKSIIVQD